ncbi:hypothetical protein [Proteus terrae]|uniref:hypothetical protein n=1 Tax=Proteus terrae TaxID=1574161 RepID=UPI001BA84A49|nr:hypothetical protein [Proteus terrae]
MPDKKNMKNNNVLTLINEVKLAEWELKLAENKKAKNTSQDNVLPSRKLTQSDKKMSYFC